MEDRHDLQRFVDAQDAVMDRVLAEITSGRKTTHWMWFVFPQLASLGRSSMARLYGLHGSEEALAYWQHPVLGARLRQCCEALLAAPGGKSALQIFGSPDDLKLRSSLTLFAAVVPDEPLFERLLQRFYEGHRDPLTLEQL
ncbi:calpastatin [Rubrivivax gelatinosus]|nr:calpastatin [Rubrivivax gelatinosus]